MNARPTPDSAPLFPPAPHAPACDGPRCYDLSPAAAYDRGLLTIDEVRDAEPVRVHRAGCAVVRALLGR